MSEEPVLLILASSLSMTSVGIWKACQSSRAHNNNNQSNNSGSNTREKAHGRGKLAGHVESEAG